MQHKITVLCDRCHNRISGIHDPDSGMTGGFYRVGGNPAKNAWAKYAKSGESTICDACMHSDKRYVADQK